MSWFHHHQWLVTGVNAMVHREKHRNDDDWIEKEHFTIVHQVCGECGELRAPRVDGTWTVEEIRDVKMNQLKA